MDRLEKAQLIAEAALGLKAEDLLALDVREIASFTDSFVFATGNSDRHVRSIADAVTEALRKAGDKPLGVEGYQDGSWVLIDANDAIVHVFGREARKHYALERLWSDAAEIPLAGPAAERAAP